jgi:hypothetical protein
MKTPPLSTFCLAPAGCEDGTIRGAAMRWVLFLGITLALLGCGARGATSGDAGPADAGDAEAGTGRRSFDVVATVTMRSLAGADMLPVTNRFTLVLDPAAGRAIAGGGGEARAVGMTTDDGRTFHITTMFGVGVSASRCNGLLRMAYETVDVTLAGRALSGRATGQAFFASPDATPTTMPFEAILDGVPDTTAPFLIVPAGATIDDPLSSFDVWVSEPLPPTALARMVGGDGAVSGLVPQVIAGDVPLIASFSKPSLTLPPGVSFQALFSDDVTDLAGNAAPMGEALRLENVGAAPLVPADGFESATDATLGGAAIVRSGPGIPIGGLASVYIGQEDSPIPAGLTLTPKLAVRIAVPPGATKLIFSYRELAFDNKADVGFVQLGSVGRAPGPATQIPTVATFQTVSWGGQTFDESPVATMDVSLPDEIGPEVIVVIRSAPLPCTLGFGSPGLLIDDLRLE